MVRYSQTFETPILGIKMTRKYYKILTSSDERPTFLLRAFVFASEPTLHKSECKNYKVQIVFAPETSVLTKQIFGLYDDSEMIE